jgi:hypothetical protein
MPRRPRPSSLRALLAALAFMTLPFAAQAQNPAPRPMSPDSSRHRPEQPMRHEGAPMGGMGMEGGRMMPMMENARLDSLVEVMHRATGAQKVTAMEQVIDALMADRKTMHEHMMQMMQRMRGRMGQGEPGCMAGEAGCPMKDSAGQTQNR